MSREQVSRYVVKRLLLDREVVRMTQKWRVENMAKICRERGLRQPHSHPGVFLIRDDLT